MDRLLDELPDCVKLERVENTPLPDGTPRHSLHFFWEYGTSGVFFSTGFFDTERDVIDFTTRIFENLEEGEIMGLLDNHRMFPAIKGVMLKDKDLIVTMDGRFEIIEPRKDQKGAVPRTKVTFSDHPKYAIINSNQMLVVFGMYGDEEAVLKGKRISLYGEHGNWGGKPQWAIRVRPTPPPPLPAKKQQSPKERAIKNAKGFIASVIDGLDFDNADAVKAGLKELGETAIPTTPDKRRQAWESLKVLAATKTIYEEE